MSRWDVRDAAATPTGEPAQPSPAQAGATERTHLSPTSCCARSQFSPFLLSWSELGFLSLATEGLLTTLGSLFRISMSWPLSVRGLQALWGHDPCLIYLLSPTAPGRILWTGRFAKYNGILFSLRLSRTDINQIQNPSAKIPSVYICLCAYMHEFFLEGYINKSYLLPKAPPPSFPITQATEPSINTPFTYWPTELRGVSTTKYIMPLYWNRKKPS